jgi:hypothetical protein
MNLQISGSVQSNLHEIEVYKQTLEIANNLNITYNYDLTKFVSIVYPYLSKESFLIVNLFFMWMWITDDFFDNPKVPIIEKQKLIDLCLDIIDTNYPHGSKLLSQFSSLYAKYQNPLNSIQQSTILLQGILPEFQVLGYSKPQELSADDLYTFWLGTIKDSLVKGVRARLNLVKPITLADFNKIRPYDSGCQMVWPLILIDNVPQRYEIVKDLEDITFKFGEIIYKVNDIHSYMRDIKDEEIESNYIHLLMKEENLEYKEAEVMTVDEINLLWKYLETLQSQYSGYHKLYLERLILWCQGNLTGHRLSNRYKLDREPNI